MEIEERKASLEDAKEKLIDAIDLIKEAVDGLEIESAVQSYIISSLEMCVDNEHGWVGKQPYNIQEIMELLEELEEGEYEDDEEDELAI